MNFNTFLKYTQFWVLKHFKAKVWDKGLWACKQSVNYSDASCFFSCLSVIVSFLMRHLKQLRWWRVNATLSVPLKLPNLWYESLPHQQPTALTGTWFYERCSLRLVSVEKRRATCSLREHSTGQLGHYDIRDIKSCLWSHPMNDQYVDCAQVPPWSCSRIESFGLC